MYPEASFGLSVSDWQQWITSNNGELSCVRLWAALKGDCARDFHLQLSTATVAESRDFSIVSTAFRAAHIPPLSVISLTRSATPSHRWRSAVANASKLPAN
jgi:hypothetical protein